MSDSPSKTVKLNEARSHYNRASGKKTLALFGVLIIVVVILLVVTVALMLKP